MSSVKLGEYITIIGLLAENGNLKTVSLLSFSKMDINKLEHALEFLQSQRVIRKTPTKETSTYSVTARGLTILKFFKRYFPPEHS